jgi:hypothetical protein
MSVPWGSPEELRRYIKGAFAQAMSTLVGQSNTKDLVARAADVLLGLPRP